VVEESALIRCEAADDAAGCLPQGVDCSCGLGVDDAIVAAGEGWSASLCRIARYENVAGIIFLVLVLILLIPPNGILSDNEENYFALAERFVDGSAWPATTAVFDASRHRMLSDVTLGSLVSAVGFVPAQVLSRLLAIVGYTLTLPALFRVFGLSVLDAALAVMAMALVGQDIIGGEWLFGGYEAKVAAYILVLAATRLVLVREQLTAAALLFAASTYFHFLVGGFWCLAAMALRLLERPRDLRGVALATSLYAILVMPLLGVIGWSRFADAIVAQATDVPPPDVIYSILREPHHQSPFLSWGYFHDHWLPGYVMALPMLLTCLLVARRGDNRFLRVVALWLAGLLAYLFFVLGSKFVDRNSGVLGRFYLFRPSSLILLLWLLLGLAVAAAMLGSRAWILRASLLALIGPAFVYIQGGRLVHEMVAHEALEHQKRVLFSDVARVVAPGDVVLIDPDVEAQLLDFERRTGRPTLVMWKFAPSNDRELIVWYRRVELRRTLFAQGCGSGMPFPDTQYLLTTPASAPRLAASCGPEVFRVGQWVLLRRETMSTPAGGSARPS
jgi:hypothetical protein